MQCYSVHSHFVSDSDNKPSFLSVNSKISTTNVFWTSTLPPLFLWIFKAVLDIFIYFFFSLKLFIVMFLETLLMAIYPATDSQSKADCTVTSWYTCVHAVWLPWCLMPDEQLHQVTKANASSIRCKQKMTVAYSLLCEDVRVKGHKLWTLWYLSFLLWSSLQVPPFQSSEPKSSYQELS